MFGLRSHEYREKFWHTYENFISAGRNTYEFWHTYENFIRQPAFSQINCTHMLSRMASVSCVSWSQRTYSSRRRMRKQWVQGYAVCETSIDSTMPILESPVSGARTVGLAHTRLLCTNVYWLSVGENQPWEQLGRSHLERLTSSDSRSHEERTPAANLRRHSTVVLSKQQSHSKGQSDTVLYTVQHRRWTRERVVK